MGADITRLVDSIVIFLPPDLGFGNASHFTVDCEWVSLYQVLWLHALHKWLCCKEIKTIEHGNWRLMVKCRVRPKSSLINFLQIECLWNFFFRLATLPTVRDSGKHCAVIITITAVWRGHHTQNELEILTEQKDGPLQETIFNIKSAHVSASITLLCKKQKPQSINVQHKTYRGFPLNAISNEGGIDGAITTCMKDDGVKTLTRSMVLPFPLDEKKQNKTKRTNKQCMYRFAIAVKNYRLF